MPHPLLLCSTVLLLTLPTLAHAQTFWTGPPIEFAKAAFANPTLPANQDCITFTACLTRGSSAGLYNAALETAYLTNVSPLNTAWAPGSIADGVGTLTFTDWRTAVGASPPTSIGKPFVLHVIDDDIYIDITFLSWNSTPSNGGAFSYARSTPADTPVPGLSAAAATLLAVALSAATALRLRRS